MIYKFKAYGHPNITAKHKTTLEFTKDKELSLRGDCIIGVRADFNLQLIKNFISQLKKNKIKIIIELEKPPLKKTIKKNSLLKNKNNQKINYDKELIKFLKIIKDESKINTVGFYDIHKLVKRHKIKKIPKREELVKKIRKKGYKVSETHFSGRGLRSDIPLNSLLKIL